MDSHNNNNNNHIKKNGLSINMDGIDLEFASKFTHVGNGFGQHKDFQPRTTSIKYLKLNSSLFKSALPCLVFLIVYGLNNTIHLLSGIGDLNCVNFHNISALEYRIFSGRPPHLFLSQQHNFVLDIMAALPYLFHYTIPVFFPLFLTFSGMKDKISRFFRLLGLAMWSHYVIWFLLPTAPPWLAEKLDQIRSLSSRGGSLDAKYLKVLQREGCAFARLDAETGWGFFKSIFDGNPVPFASFPSGHVAWPVCMALTTSWGKRGRIFFFFYIGWVGWSTMYSCHHYFTDILAAIAVVWFMEFLERRCGAKRPLSRY